MRYLHDFGAGPQSVDLMTFLFLKTVFCDDDRSSRREKQERADTSWGAGILRGPCHKGETTLISAIFGPTVKCLADTQTDAALQ